MEDEFDLAFAANGGGPEQDPHEDTSGAAGPSGTGGPASPGAAAEAGDLAAAPASAPAAPAPAAAAPAPAVPAAAPSAPAAVPADDDDPAKLKQRVSTLQGMLRKEADDKAELRRQLDEAKKTPPASAAPAAAPVPASVLTEEDEALLRELEETAPHLVKGMQAYLKRERAAIDKAVEEKLGKANQEVTSRVAPLEQAHEDAAVRDHFAAISQAHPDWEEVVVSPDLIAWVQGQPGYLQREFARIAQSGTSAEIIEVLDSYRKAVPRAAAPAAAPVASPAPAASAPQGAPADAITAKRQAQKRAMGTTDSRPAPLNPAGTPNKDDFGAGFDMAASQT